MSDKEKEILDEEADVIVEMTDEEGNSYYYREEMIIPVGDDKFALLIGIHEEEEEEHAHSCGCGCGEHDEDVLIAKVVMGEDGEEEYVEPTDEEFDAVQRAYDALMDEEED